MIRIFKEVRETRDCEALQRDLDNVVMWAQKWQMSFNVKKCKVMHVGRQTDCCNYYMAGSKLTEETLENYLGILISADMKCSQQRMYAANKASKVLGMIKRTISYKDPKIMVNLYKTLVRPRVEYCVSAWSPYYKKDKELLEKYNVGLREWLKVWEGSHTMSDYRS